MVQDGEAAVGAMEVWVLAGQSNMAGRGSVDALPPDYTPSPRISALNGSGAWIAPAVDPMHVDVDLRKAERCGVGPGLPFARAILDVNRESMHIGLVPCALGGTSLDEWMPEFQYAGPGSSPGIDPAYLAQTCSPNPFHAMLYRVRSAIDAAPPGSRLSGLLWYQGENDAMDVDDAASYSSRFASWAAAVRQHLNAAQLPVAVVNVTAASAKLTQLKPLRDQIFQIPQVVPHSLVVDAFGLPQHEDGLHLSTQAQLELGRRLALAWHAQHSSASGGKDREGDDDMPDELRARPEHRQMWQWADPQIRQAYLRLQSVQEELERRQAAFHEGLSRVEMDMTRLLRTLREREEVLNQLAAGEAAPSLSSRPAAMPLLPSEAEPPPTADLGHGDERPLQLSTQQQELLLPATDAQPSPPRRSIKPPSPVLVDEALLARAHLLSRNVDRVLAEAQGRLAATNDPLPQPTTATEEESCGHLPTELVEAHQQSPSTSLAAEAPPSTARPLADAAGGAVAGPRGPNLTYGEVDPLSFLQLLAMVAPNRQRRPRIFLDLGCGEGRTLVAAAASGLFDQVCGIELLPGHVETARLLLLDILPQQQPEAAGGEVRQGDLFDGTLWPAEASLAYFCATCFDNDQVTAVGATAAARLGRGARLVLLDKALPPGATDMRLVLRCQCLVSWGTATAFVYEAPASVD